jgi:hypothetical protein
MLLERRFPLCRRLSRLLDASEKEVGVTPVVKAGDHPDPMGFDHVVDHVREAMDRGAPDPLIEGRVDQRGLAKLLQQGTYRFPIPGAKPWSLLLALGFEQIAFGQRPDDDREGH